MGLLDASQRRLRGVLSLRAHRVCTAIFSPRVVSFGSTCHRVTAVVPVTHIRLKRRARPGERTWPALIRSFIHGATENCQPKSVRLFQDSGDHPDPEPDRGAEAFLRPLPADGFAAERTRRRRDCRRCFSRYFRSPTSATFRSSTSSSSPSATGSASAATSRG